MNAGLLNPGLYLSIHGNAAVRTDDGAQSATGAFVHWVQQDDRPVPFTIEIFGQLNHILRTGGSAQFATFTSLYVNNNSTMSHLGPPIWEIYKSGDGLAINNSSFKDQTLVGTVDYLRRCGVKVRFHW
jgi:hypothetical protein